jgi:hypothetical protein
MTVTKNLLFDSIAIRGDAKRGLSMLGASWCSTSNLNKTAIGLRFKGIASTGDAKKGQELL